MQHSTFDYNAHCEKIIFEWNGRQELIHTATCCIVWKTNVGGKKRKRDEKCDVWNCEKHSKRQQRRKLKETLRIEMWICHLIHDISHSYSRCDATILLVWECNQKTSYCKFWQMSDRNMIKHSRGSIHRFSHCCSRYPSDWSTLPADWQHAERLLLTYFRILRLCALFSATPMSNVLLLIN